MRASYRPRGAPRPIAPEPAAASRALAIMHHISSRYLSSPRRREAARRLKPMSLRLRQLLLISSCLLLAFNTKRNGEGNGERKAVHHTFCAHQPISFNIIARHCENEGNAEKAKLHRGIIMGAVFLPKMAAEIERVIGLCGEVG